MVDDKALKIKVNCYSLLFIAIRNSHSITTRSGGLLKDLQEILQTDELHLMSLLVKDVNLRVNTGKGKDEHIKTEIGSTLGDCLSGVLFTFYLARSINSINTEITATDPSRKNNYFERNPQFSDDITWTFTVKHRIDHIIKTIPVELDEGSLQLN